MLNTLSRQTNETPCRTIDTLIGAKAELQGHIACSGGLRIDGKVKGNITAEDGDNSILILGEYAEVRGNITVPHLVSNGKIRGQVYCSTRIELESQAEIYGDVHYRALRITPGAVIHGNLVHETEGETETGVMTKHGPGAPPTNGAH